MPKSFQRLGPDRKPITRTFNGQLQMKAFCAGCHGEFWIDTEDAIPLTEPVYCSDECDPEED